MKSRLLRKTASGLMFVCLAALLNNCSTAPGKTVHKKYTVEIRSMQFQPAELTVEKGDTVVFVNRDMVAHNVTEQKSNAWASPSLFTGQLYTKVVNEAADYYCTFHPVMKGKLLMP